MTRGLRSRYLAALPAAGVLLLLFSGGLVLGILQSVGLGGIRAVGGFSLSAYGHLLTGAEFLPALGISLYLAAVSTCLSVVLAVATALLLRRILRNRTAAFFYQLPLTVPHVVLAVGALFLLDRGGFLARLAYAAQWIDAPADFPSWVNDRWGVGIIAVYVWKQIPFIGLLILSILQSVGEDYEAVGRTLGAGKWFNFRRIILPLIIPAILPGSVIIFAYVFGAFEVPLLLGRIHPPAVSVLAYRLYTDTDLGSRSEAMAAGLLIALSSGVLSALYLRLTAKRREAVHA